MYYISKDGSLKSTDELYHHGILGMKWGKLNGPPYPIGSGPKKPMKEREAAARERKKYSTVQKTGNTYFIKDKTGKVVSKLNFYDYKIKGFDWVLMANLDTNKADRGNGLATKLLDSLYKDVSSKGKGVYMMVRSNNKKAIRLYNKLDFRSLKPYTLDGKEYLIMIKGNPSDKQFDNMSFS